MRPGWLNVTFVKLTVRGLLTLVVFLGGVILFSGAKLVGDDFFQVLLTLFLLWLVFCVAILPFAYRIEASRGLRGYDCIKLGVYGGVITSALLTIPFLFAAITPSI